MRARLSTLLTVLIVALPSAALACPVCAQNTSGNQSFAYLLFGMMLLPFPVAAVVFWLIRRGQLEHGERAPQAPAING